MRRCLLIVGLLGTFVFAAAFLASLWQPILVEKAARELIRVEVGHSISGQLEALSDTRIAALARQALHRTTQDLEVARRELELGLPQKVAEGVARMLKADCPCRKSLTDAAVDAQQQRIASLSDAKERLDRLIEAAYASVARSLLREVRIFSASNAAAFLGLVLVARFRRGAALQLLLPAVVLLGAVAVTGSLYLFQQDWLHTILFGDYVGLAYLAYLVLAATGLADIAFNKARITTRLVNAALQALGAALKAVPC